MYTQYTAYNYVEFIKMKKSTTILLNEDFNYI